MSCSSEKKKEEMIIRFGDTEIKNSEQEKLLKINIEGKTKF